MKIRLTKFKALVFLPAIFLLTTCVKDNKPTKPQMVGVWEVTSAYNESGQDILSQISFPVVGFSLSSDNILVSTAGPMMMYVVYGPSQFVNIAAKLGQVFDYSTLSFNGGEFFVADGVVDRFTLEMKLEGLPGQNAITSLLTLLNVQSQWMQTVVYHKFMDVGITFNYDNSQMTWTFDNTTKALYNMKDQYGNYVTWGGWPVANFSKCTFVLTKRTNDLKSIVQQHI